MTRSSLREAATTNTRPYSIFWSYMGTCLFLTVFIVSKLVPNSAVIQKFRTTQSPSTRHVRLFAALAAGSLLTTWGFMIRYFQFSYQTWFASRSHYALDPQHKYWGLWLKETSLFREAWETVIIGETRYWWSNQIFFFALGLGLYLEHAGIRRGIKHTWAFMLLGQIVAISFATNLFLLTLLLHPSTPTPATSKTPNRKWIGSWIITLLSVFATVIPAWLLADKHYWHTPSFMPILLTPHLALMILPTARALLPERCFPSANVNASFNDKVYSHMRQAVFVTGALMLIKTTTRAYAVSGFQGIWVAFLEHPAVTSVGFDVVFCWVTWICWWMIQDKGLIDSRRISMGTGYGESNTGSSTAVKDSSVDAGARLR